MSDDNPVAAIPSEDVTVTAGTNQLHGTVFHPDGTGPHPAIVCVLGSKAANYTEYLETDDSSLFRSLVSYFHAQGCSVLFYNKPGVGSSTGDWKRESFHDRAENVLAAVEYLRARDDIDAENVGVVGHSQGGWIAQLVGATYPDSIHFIVTLAGPSTSVRQQILDDFESVWTCDGASDRSIRIRSAILSMGLGLLDTIAPVWKPTYLSHIVGYDPADAIAAISVPTLALFGENDRLCPPEPNRRRLEALFGTDTGSDTDTDTDRLTVHVVSGANHRFHIGDFCGTTESSDGVASELFDVLDRGVRWNDC